MRQQALLMGLAGGIGGASSNLLDLARHLTGANPVPPGVLWVVGTAIFFSLGAAVAMVFQETDSKKAFFLGIGLPALIAAAATTNGPISQQPLTPAAAKPTSFFQLPALSVPLYAQGAAKSATGPTKAASAAAKAATPVAAQTLTPTAATSAKEVMTLVPNGNLSDVGDYSISFFDAKGTLLGSTLVPNPKAPFKVTVPTAATKFGVWNNNVTQRVWELPSKANDLKIAVTPQRQYTNDFWRALGNRNLKAYELSVQPLGEGAQ